MKKNMKMFSLFGRPPIFTRQSAPPGDKNQRGSVQQACTLYKLVQQSGASSCLREVHAVLFCTLLCLKEEMSGTARGRDKIKKKQYGSTLLLLF